ncbi:Protein archease [Nitrosotalea devaniterrae]|uniref:Protein archease n=1 Tax=Nitrosotalea devaniterrae TaxID=1078905 RepID=A0A128A5K1_9ARCH|nr:Protein archease [Candidatus Nitrosotalea devanaterra]
MAYRDLDHMTDAFIEVVGNTMDEAFGNAGISVVDTIVDIKSVENKEDREIEIHANDLKNLLYSWLEEVIILTITDGFAGKVFNVKITKNGTYHLLAKVSGEEINFVKHHFKMEIKSPTYHLMEIIDEKPVLMRFLLDL